MSPDILLCMFNEFMSPQIELQFYQVGAITIWPSVVWPTVS